MRKASRKSSLMLRLSRRATWSTWRAKSSGKLMVNTRERRDRDVLMEPLSHNVINYRTAKPFTTESTDGTEAGQQTSKRRFEFPVSAEQQLSAFSHQLSAKGNIKSKKTAFSYQRSAKATAFSSRLDTSRRVHNVIGVSCRVRGVHDVYRSHRS